jgi:hydroxyethylthiazole kinase-like uncharacterized protein yjeF
VAPNPIPFPNPIYSTDQLREIEAIAANIFTSPSLMQRAGLATAEIARELVSDQTPGILVLAGPGNNGGDAFVAAQHLKAWWYRVDVVFAGDADALPADAKAAYEAWIEGGGTCFNIIPDRGHWGLVIDGLFGIGLTRPVEGVYADLIAQANKLNAPILALDIPSGLNADSGRALGPVIRATHTVTFVALKAGLLTGDGPDFCGNIWLRTLNLNTPQLAAPNGWLLERPLVAKLLPPRPLNSHKVLFGSVGVLGGASGMAGAALLAARAALKLGAGRVYLGLLDLAGMPFDVLQPELMLRTAQEILEIANLSCLVVGPGMGQSALAMQWLTRAIETDLPLVLDADALNLLAQDSALQAQVGKRRAPTILTPHVAEAARLISANTDAVRYQRVDVATILATRFNSFVVLKGAGSVCAQPNGAWYINGSGNPGLASAGTGDVLAGMVGALLAQGMGARDALLLGVFLHGTAADELSAKGIGPIGMTASEVIDAARGLLNHWVYG